MYAKRYIETSTKIIKSYQGDIPLNIFLKKFFSADKKYGSRDRKQIASLCYNYFRLGHAADNTSIEDKFLLGTFLTEHKSSELLESVRPEWNALIQKPLEEKISTLKIQFSIDKIFLYKNELCPGIDVEKFNLSFLIQPKLFLRIRPGKFKKVTGKLAGAGISYNRLTDSCVALPNSSKINSVIDLDKEAVVQDYNSQRVGELLLNVFKNCKEEFPVWDCCAASGGKSILAYDINPDIELTVSDKRESILKNLHNRFAISGIKKYHSFVADLENPAVILPTHNFDLIICDAPCTGSGTWARTPEQLNFFKKDAIERYATTQKNILQRVVQYLRPGGYILYITCSVFKKENEDIIEYAQKKLSLTLKESQLFTGYEIKADTMFASLLQK